ncbi:MAG TPA: DUF951 domain-containing protein [Dehalococcoidia bacterium]|jgi:hypothetical protein
MALSGPTEYRMDDIVRLRKPHPCGGFDWRVVRLGADIGLRCLTCNHRVLLDRSTLDRRLKTFIERGPYDPRDPFNASGTLGANG